MGVNEATDKNSFSLIRTHSITNECDQPADNIVQQLSSAFSIALALLVNIYTLSSVS